jgi:septal ring factor EnvC (AmiA/AmiB activator)
MTPETSVSIALLISLTSLVCTLINTFAGGKKRQEEQAEREKNRQMDIEKNFVKINVKLDDFCDTSKKLMQENKEKTDQLRQVTERLAIISERCDTLFKYKDDHEKRIVALEKRDD